jgi:hypothetical protein
VGERLDEHLHEAICVGGAGEGDKTSVRGCGREPLDDVGLGGRRERREVMNEGEGSVRERRRGERHVVYMIRQTCFSPNSTLPSALPQSKDVLPDAVNLLGGDGWECRRLGDDKTLEVSDAHLPDWVLVSLTKHTPRLAVNKVGLVNVADADERREDGEGEVCLVVRRPDDVRKVVGGQRKIMRAELAHLRRRERVAVPAQELAPEVVVGELEVSHEGLAGEREELIP